MRVVGGRLKGRNLASPATRDIRVSWTRMVHDPRASKSHLRAESSSAEFPHCEAHDDGVKVGDVDGMPRSIRFRALPALRAYCRLNALKPVALDVPEGVTS